MVDWRWGQYYEKREARNNCFNFECGSEPLTCILNDTQTPTKTLGTQNILNLTWRNKTKKEQKINKNNEGETVFYYLFLIRKRPKLSRHMPISSQPEITSENGMGSK